MYKYEIIIYWSREDKAFIAGVPELPGCLAHGKAPETALKNAKEAIQLWTESKDAFQVDSCSFDSRLTF